MGHKCVILSLPPPLQIGNLGMALKKSDLYSSLWASCDELRGGMRHFATESGLDLPSHLRDRLVSALESSLLGPVSYSRVAPLGAGGSGGRRRTRRVAA
jgi:hypothetical protein